VTGTKVFACPTLHFNMKLTCKWNQLGAQFLSVYFVNFIYNLCMFRTSPGPSSGGTTVFIRHLVLVILYSCLVCRSICSCIPNSQLYRI